MPAKSAHPATEARYIIAVALPSDFHIVIKDAALVAGPVIRKTRAAPGVRPFIIRAAATGTDAVAHT